MKKVNLAFVCLTVLTATLNGTYLSCEGRDIGYVHANDWIKKGTLVGYTFPPDQYLATNNNEKGFFVRQIMSSASNQATAICKHFGYDANHAWWNNNVIGCQNCKICGDPYAGERRNC